MPTPTRSATESVTAVAVRSRPRVGVGRSSTAPLDSAYSPAQQRVIDLLGRRADEGSVIDPTEIETVRRHLDDRLGLIASQIPAGQSLWIGKSSLTNFESCASGWKASLDEAFRWSVPSVRGSVSHKAIELSLNWRGEAEPARMVDAAIEHLVDHGGSAGTYLRTLTTVELAELRSVSVELVTSFEECFPPLRSRWRPVLEGRMRAEFGGGRIVLAGKPDLTLGRSTAGGKVIIDFKSGSRSRTHIDDLRFYALIDALRIGIAPRRVATVYLDSGWPVAETVTAGVLHAAADRVVATVDAMVATRWGTAPAELRAGHHCSWCPARETCVAGLDRARSDTGQHAGW